VLQQIRSLFRVLKSRDDFERGMSEELLFHIQQYESDLVRVGVSPQEAARRARIAFGSLNRTQEECREARRLQPFDELRRQLRHAGRTLLKTRGFTATALVTLAVCVGANLTIFAVVNFALYLINTEFNPARLWHVWPLAGWGIGIVFHGLGVFFLGSGTSLRQRMIERERRLLDAQTR